MSPFTKSSDRWMCKIPRDSRKADRLAGRTDYDTRDFIDTPYLLHLQTKQQNECYYCQTQLCWRERRRAKNGLTVERIDSRLPHLKSNCVLCCKSCNSKRYTRDHGLLKRYFTKWKKKTFDIPRFVDLPRAPRFL